MIPNPYTIQRLFPILLQLQKGLHQDILAEVVRRSHIKSEAYNIFHSGYSNIDNKMFVCLLMDDAAYRKMCKYWAYGGRSCEGVYWTVWQRKHTLCDVVAVQVLTNYGAPGYQIQAAIAKTPKPPVVKYANLYEQQFLMYQLQLLAMPNVNQGVSLS